MSRKTYKNFNATNNKNRNTKVKNKTKNNNEKTTVKDASKSNNVANNVVTTTNNTTQNNANNKFTYGYYNNKKNYDYKGKKNKTTFPEFVNLCRHTQDTLKMLLERKLLAAGYGEVISGDGYIYAKGNIPILLTAHMDTVHKIPVIDVYEYYDEEKKQHIISSPQGIGGDDRCGIYMILELIKTHKCSVMFCEDEESGCIGSTKFATTKLIDELSDLKYLIELDRANSDDAVFYDCENDEFTDFILTNTGYKNAWGSCSDISVLSPACKIASVNFSCGYYNAHTTSEYVIVEEMLNTIDMVRELLDVECEQFEYIEKQYSFGKYGTYSWDDYYDGFYGRYSGGYSDGYYWRDKSNYTTKNKDNDKDNEMSRAKKKEIAYGYSEERSLYITVYNEEIEDMLIYISNGITVDDAFGKFFRANPDLCFSDVFDYDFYDCKVYEDGWYTCDGLN